MLSALHSLIGLPSTSTLALGTLLMVGFALRAAGISPFRVAYGIYTTRTFGRAQQAAGVRWRAAAAACPLLLAPLGPRGPTCN